MNDILCMKIAVNREVQIHYMLQMQIHTRVQTDITQIQCNRVPSQVVIQVPLGIP